MRTVPTGQLPPGLAEALRPQLSTLGDELITTIAREVPAYARPLEGSFGRGVQRGVEEGLTRFIEMVAGTGVQGIGAEGIDEDERSAVRGREVYVALGRGEVRAGRTLDTLLGAYRVGARIAWRRLAIAATRDGGIGTEELVVLAEMMFAYIDEISAASAEGYAQAQSSAVGERHRLAERLAAVLLSGAEPAEVRVRARDASFTLSDMLTAAVVPTSAEQKLGMRLPLDTPTTVKEDRVWVFLADTGPVGRRARLSRTLTGLGAVIGPTVPWQDAAASAARADSAYRAREAGLLAGADDPVFAEEHLLDLVLGADRALIGELAVLRLAPLSALPERTRARHAETLLAWLALRGQRAGIAEHLHVHPQTVRYRINQLRALFGPALDDPQTRFELELVLRAGYT